MNSASLLELRQLPSNRLNQFAGLGVKRTGQLKDDSQGWRLQTSFQLTDVARMKVSFVGQILLS